MKKPEFEVAVVVVCINETVIAFLSNTYYQANFNKNGDEIAQKHCLEELTSTSFEYILRKAEQLDTQQNVFNQKRIKEQLFHCFHYVPK